MANWSIFVSFLLLAAIMVKGNDVCHEPGCQCNPNPTQPELVDVICNCGERQNINIGPSDAEKSRHNARGLKPATAQIEIRGCHHVEIFGRALNHLPHLKKISISGSHKVVLHTRLHESRVGNGGNLRLTSFKIENVRELKVSGQTFEGIVVEDSFLLNDVTIQRVSPMAFGFDFVEDFEIINSRFERVPMWGFKLKCRMFSISESSYFSSLANAAIHISAEKFMMAKSKFGTLQDSSFQVRFGFANISGNVFETFLGKPFNALSLYGAEEMSTAHIDSSNIGLVFMENQFASDPTLPIDSLSMPVYTDLVSNPSHQIVIRDNHFVCQCGRADWFVGAVKYGFDLESITSLDFLRKVYETSGKCLECGLKSCKISDNSFSEFSANLYLERTINGPLKCSTTPPAIPTTEAPSQKPEESRVMAGNSNHIKLCSVILALSTTLSTLSAF